MMKIKLDRLELGITSDFCVEYIAWQKAFRGKLATNGLARFRPKRGVLVSDATVLLKKRIVFARRPAATE